MWRLPWVFTAAFLLSGCSPALRTPSKTVFYVFRREPPAIIELAPGGSSLQEIPFTVPAGCEVVSMFAPPRGATLAIELNCSFGQAVAWLDTDNGEIRQPVTDSDSHFMAWAADGQATYLKVDSLNRPHIILAQLGGKTENVPITELAYDISPKPGSQSYFLFSFSRGMGLGSEMWLAQFGGELVKHMISDGQSYLSFARWSPDGSRVAFIKVPDSATPFTVGELWVMQADGSNAHRLAQADAGHGFAEAWSPDGKQIAFVLRANAEDAQADQNADALQSNIAIVSADGGTQSPLTHFPKARVEEPAWSPDGNSIAFTVVLNDKMTVYQAEISSGQVQQTLSVSTCCPVWMQK